MSTLNVTNLPNQEKRMATAWVNFNGTGTVSIRDQYNVSSITDNGPGLYTLNFTVPLDSSNYSVATTTLGDAAMAISGISGPTATGAVVKTTTQLQVRVRAVNNDAVDSADMNVCIFGGTT